MNTPLAPKFGKSVFLTRGLVHRLGVVSYYFRVLMSSLHETDCRISSSRSDRYSCRFGAYADRASKPGLCKKVQQREMSRSLYGQV